jgi:hypothetical protein
VSDRGRIGRALLEAMRPSPEGNGGPGGEPSARLRGVDAERIVRAARHHGAAGYLYAALRDTGDRQTADPALVDALATAYHLGLGIAMRTTADLGTAAATLDGAGIPWMVVKGPALERLHPEPGMRPYDDVDLVVPARSFAEAMDALDADRSRTLDRNWRLVRREQRGQVHLVMPHGSLADLHWHLVNRDRAPFAIPMEELFERVRHVDVGGPAVPTLDPTDTVIHACLHDYLSGGHRLIWMKDLERALAIDPPDWDSLVERAHAWRVAVPVAAMLSRAARLLEAAVPQEIPAALGTPVRRRLDRAGTRFLRPERSTGKWSLATLPARLLGRPGPVPVYARRAARRLGRYGAPDRLFVEAGGEEDRRAYLDSVTSS